MRKSSIGPLRVRNEATPSGKSKARVSGSGSRSRLSSSSSRSSFGGGRPSLLGQPGKSQGRPSVIPNATRRTSSRSYGHHEALKDPRPINDRHYKDKSIRELIEFLAEKGYPHPCSIKILHSPSSKEFIRIFEFLYSLLEPGFKCIGKIEEQFPTIMKSLGYPFIISKSAMYAIGSPHTWPTLLAALSWLKSSIEYCMNLDVERVLFPGNSDDFEGVPMTKTVFRYCESTYNAFLQGADTFEELDEQLGKEIRKNSPGGDMESLIHEQKRLLQEHESLAAEPDPLIELKDKQAMLRQDKDKLKKYIESLEGFKSQLSSQLRNFQLEEQTLAAEAEVLKADNSKKQTILKTQVFSKADVHRINMERQMLQEQIKMNKQEIEAIQKEIWDEERQIAKAQEQIQKKCDEYNSMAKMLNLIPPTAENDIDYELRPQLEEVHSNHFHNTIKPALTQLKSRCMDTSNQLAQSQIIGQNNLAQLHDHITERTSELTSLEKRAQSEEQKLDVTKAVQQNETQRIQDENDLLEAQVKDLYLNRNIDLVALSNEVKDERQKLAVMCVNNRKEEKRACNFIQGIFDLIISHKCVIQEHTEKVATDLQKCLEEERQN